METKGQSGVAISFLRLSIESNGNTNGFLCEKINITRNRQVDDRRSLLFGYYLGYVFIFRCFPIVIIQIVELYLIALTSSFLYSRA